MLLAVVFELDANKHKKLKVEKSNLTTSCIYKIAQSILCYTFCCQHITKHLTIENRTELKLPLIIESCQT